VHKNAPSFHPELRDEHRYTTSDDPANDSAWNRRASAYIADDASFSSPDSIISRYRAREQGE